MTVVFDFVDQLIAHRPDDRRLPALERGGPEGLGHQAAVVVVFLAAHRQDRVAHHQADGLLVGGRGEDPVVAERLKHAVIAEQHPLVVRPQFLRHLMSGPQRAVPDRIGAPHVFEERIGAGFTGEVESDGLAAGVGA